MRHKRLCRFLRLLAVIAMLACAVPGISAADAANTADSTGFISPDAVPENIRALLHLDTAPADTPARRAAAPALRIVDTDDPSSIRLEDNEGNGTAHVFAAPVRYETEAGETAFIDTSMTAESALSALFTGYAWRNTANSFALRYAKRPDTGLDMDGDFTMAVWPAAEQTFEDGTIDQTADGDGRVTYPAAFGEHTSLEYINTATGVKENIILEENIGKNRFDFVFRSATHRPILSEDETTIFVVRSDDPDEAADYTISPLYVYDSCVIDTESDTPSGSHRHYTEDCRYELTSLEDGGYRITSVVSADFLNDPETTYPVTIDPNISNGASYVTDTYVHQQYQTSSYGTLDYMRFGRTGSYLLFSLIRFDTLMQTLPQNSSVTSATMKFTFRSGQNTGSRGALWRVTEYWTENVTFDACPGVASWQTNVAESASNYVNGYIDNYTFNVTTLVKNWMTGIYPYYGVYLTYTSHAVQDYNSVVSSDGEASRAPVLSVNYRFSETLPTGLTANGIYYVRNYNSGKYLQASGNFSPLTQRTFNGSRNQQWEIRHTGSGWYTFVPMSDVDIRIDVTNGDDYNGQDLQTCVSNNTNAQAFRILPNGDGTYRLQTKSSYNSKTKPGSNSNMVMEVTSGSTADGAQVQIWEYQGLRHMKWELIQTPDSQDNAVLSPEDKATVMALKRDYILYRNQSANVLVTYDNLCVSIMRAIDVIRRQSQYRGKYAFSDSSGYCNWSYMYEVGYSSSMQFYPVSITTRPPEDYTMMCNWALSVAGMTTKFPYSTLLSLVSFAAVPPEPIDILAFALDFLPEERLGTVVDIIALISSYEDYKNSTAVGTNDIQVRIWYFTPNNISAYESFRLFVRTNYKVRHETHRSENVSSPPGYPDYDRSDVVYHNFQRHGSSSPGLVVNF